MVELCSWATLHFLRFGGIETADTLDLTRQPEGAASWQIGPDGEVGPEGIRLPSNIWCAVGLYRQRTDAQRAVATPEEFMPFLAQATEAWHALLLPVANRGECNHLDPAAPGLMLQPAASDPGGPLVVVTTAGFDRGPDFSLARVISFRRAVDAVRDTVAGMDGNLARQVFTPHVVGPDGFTCTVWRDDKAMMAYAYRPGRHRTVMERYKAEQTADRTSFSRFRVLECHGQWEGRCPIAAAATT